ncbi:methyltransferase domain-containing protein [Aestuariibacter sp. AA17]|uniref:tRNA 5-carboxymethoxyuridine methyltransferase n=1 Tax=Fluctibacter corallii TaxID=2984329 RepID=A0ABT3A9K1_9ALTE|nr:methyltransferase [Aestuariibacter sp. AA17]MCV2885355.1 methyltransferase domain-containing protein [Aestuariibacter sp. AA17]
MKDNNKPDQSFNTIANKFEKNIYGSSKGRLRHELLVSYLADHLESQDPPLLVLDAGGGTGEMAKEFALKGHQVLVNDISEDALSLCKDKLSHCDNVHYHLGKIQSLDSTDIQHIIAGESTHFDLVLCHAVLEWLETPEDTIAHLVSLLKPNGWLSLSFFNEDAHRFANLLYGNFDFVKNGMRQRNTVRLNPNNAQSPSYIKSILSHLPVSIKHEAGIRCFHDYMRPADRERVSFEEIIEMEKRYAKVLPYRDLGRYYHILVQKL